MAELEQYVAPHVEVQDIKEQPRYNGKQETDDGVLNGIYEMNKSVEQQNGSADAMETVEEKDQKQTSEEMNGEEVENNATGSQNSKGSSFITDLAATEAVEKEARSEENTDDTQVAGIVADCSDSYAGEAQSSKNQTAEHTAYPTLAIKKEQKGTHNGVENEEDIDRNYHDVLNDDRMLSEQMPNEGINDKILKQNPFSNCQGDTNVIYWKNSVDDTVVHDSYHPVTDQVNMSGLNDGFVYEHNIEDLINATSKEIRFEDGRDDEIQLDEDAQVSHRGDIEIENGGDQLNQQKRGKKKKEKINNILGENTATGFGIKDNRIAKLGSCHMCKRKNKFVYGCYKCYIATSCNKFFCIDCLLNGLGINILLIIQKEETWKCPYKVGSCLCRHCQNRKEDFKIPQICEEEVLRLFGEAPSKKTKTKSDLINEQANRTVIRDKINRLTEFNGQLMAKMHKSLDTLTKEEIRFYNSLIHDNLTVLDNLAATQIQAENLREEQDEKKSKYLPSQTKQPSIRSD